MFATKDGDRLYLTSWEYNAVLILNELASMVEQMGGRVEPSKRAVISNRAVSSEIRELTQRIERLAELEKMYGENELRTNAIASAKNRLAAYEQFDNTPIEVRGQTWLAFAIEDTYYYYSFDDNPFFDFYYRKTKINGNGEINADAGCEVDPRHWEHGHNIMSHTFTAKERSEVARAILDMLMAAKNSDIIRSKKKVRVDNLYDGGYHYEEVYEKPRYRKINF